MFIYLEIWQMKCKEELNQKYNIMEEIIDNFYEEIEEHIEENKCYTMQCNHLD